MATLEPSMKHTFSLACLILLASNVVAQSNIINFEDKSLPANSYYNGSDSAGGFTSGGAFFNNSYTPPSPPFDEYWSGWSYSNVNNTTTPGYENQYAAVTGTGVGGSGIYGVAFNYSSGVARITLPTGTLPLSMSVTNTTYAFLSMLNGDGFAKKFGGASGNDPDFFLLTIEGRDANNNLTGTVPFYLADYRFANNAQDYIVNTWQSVDLSSLAATTRSLTFDMTSSDNGDFGMNTPSYFAIDSMVLAVPEPSTLVLVAGTGLMWVASWYLRVPLVYLFTKVRRRPINVDTPFIPLAK